MSSKSKKTETTQTQSATQANTPSWIQGTHQNYMQGVNDLMGQGANAFTPAGPNALQQQAFQGASNLTTSPLFGQAAGIAGQVAGAGANTAGDAQLASASGYTGQGYDPNLVDWSQFGVSGVNVSPMAQAASRNFTDVDLGGYMNTGLNDLLGAAQADYDATGGRARAAQTAQAALNGGARNSNNAIQAALMEGELSRAANTGLSQLRYDAFNTAAGLAQNDLNREASTSQFNAGQTNQGLLTQAQLDANRNNLQAQLAQAGLLANQSAQNTASQFGANASNQANAFNASALNDMSQFNASAQNQNNQFNAGQMDQALIRQLSAAGLLGELGTAQGAYERDNIALQSALGDQQYQMDLMRQQYPLQYQQIMQSLSGFNPALYSGSTTNSNVNSTSTSKTSDPLGSLGALLGGAGSLFSPIKIPGLG